MRAAVLVLVAACAPARGGTGPTAATAHAASGDAPSCAAVAAHLVMLAEQDNAAPVSDELGAGIYAEAERQCTTARWPPARRGCLARAAAQDETLGCPAR